MNQSNGQTNGANGRSKPGLLWSKDPGSRFPFTEIRRACECFAHRLEFRGWIPTQVYIHPDHMGLLDNPPPDHHLPEGISVVADEKVARFYVIVKGEPGSPVDEENFDDFGEDFAGGDDEITDFGDEITDFDDEIGVFEEVNWDFEVDNLEKTSA